MFEGFTLISVVFRIINAGILVALFTYLFRRYALDDIKATMAGEEEEFILLAQRAEQRFASTQQAKQDLVDQELLCVALTKKVDAWQAVCNNELAQREQEKERLLQHLIAKNQQQSDNVAFDSVQRHVLPMVLVKAQDQLETIFASDQKGRSYIAHLVGQLEKGKI